jgi:hypothetical protein
MKVLLFGWQKNHYFYEGLSENIGHSNVLSFLPEIFMKRYGDIADSYDSSSVAEVLDDFDVIVFTPRSFYEKNFRQVLKHKSSVTKVFLDLDDDFLLRNIYKSNEIELYFKRELLKNINISDTMRWYPRHLYGSQILPPIHRKIGLPYNFIESLPYKIAVKNEKDRKLKALPLTVSLKDGNLRDSGNDRSLDLFFCLTLSTIHERHSFYRRVRKLKYDFRSFNSVVCGGGMPKNEYIRNMLNSKAAVSIRGMGYDTDRYWEIPRYGAALFSQKIPIEIENNFDDGKSALFFENFTGFQSKFEKFVIKSDEWQEIAKQGRICFETYHTPKQRVLHSFIEKLELDFNRN